MKKRIFIFLMVVTLAIMGSLVVLASDGYVSGTLSRNSCVNSIIDSYGNGSSYVTFNKCHGGMFRAQMDMRGFQVPVLNPSGAGAYLYHYDAFNDYVTQYRVSGSVSKQSDNFIIKSTSHHTYIRCTNTNCYSEITCPGAFH